MKETTRLDEIERKLADAQSVPGMPWELASEYVPDVHYLLDALRQVEAERDDLQRKCDLQRYRLAELEGFLRD